MKTITLKEAYTTALQGKISTIANCETSERHRYSLINDNVKLIADITAVAWKHGKQKKDPQAAANAALLAHAFNVLPEVVEALEKALVKCSSISANIFDDNLDRQKACANLRDVTQSARAAIAKANTLQIP